MLYESGDLELETLPLHSCCALYSFQDELVFFFTKNAGLGLWLELQLIAMKYFSKSLRVMDFVVSHLPYKVMN